MKTSPFLIVFIGSLTLLMTGCHKKSHVWDEKQKSKRQSEKATALLWGEESGDNDSSFSGPSSEEFLPLNDEDLKNQFTDVSIPQPSRTLGEGGVPSLDAFSEPRGELATIFRPLFFNTDDHVLRAKTSLETVRRMAAYLKAHPKAVLIIQGHCDERGPEAYNMSLGTRRANYIRSLLVKEGVNREQLHTISFGKERPFALGHAESAWSQNRRAHFLIHVE